MTNDSKPTKAASKSDNVIAIKTLKTYQDVQFDRNLHTYFTALRREMEGMTIEFNVTQQLIHIKHPKSSTHIIVVPANVQYLEPA
jgi:hypothetical protein